MKLRIIAHLFFILIVFEYSDTCWAQLESQHDVKFIVSALTSPIPDDIVVQARNFDDQSMSTGSVEGMPFYLVTDNRSQRVNALVLKLLGTMEQEHREWVVRVLDTQPPINQAFVTAGKYIYVFTGLLEGATSDDELAFVLSHELGHSLLKHYIRSRQDTSNVLSGIAEMIAAVIGKKAYNKVTGVTDALQASYSQLNEEEADAIGVAITWKAGFDPLRGADFFTRGKKLIEETKNKALQIIAQNKRAFDEAKAHCEVWGTTIKNNPLRYGSRENKEKANAFCLDAENKRQVYNHDLEKYNLWIAGQQNNIYNSHPPNQNRVAAIAALTDFVRGRRDMESLQGFQQSYRVMLALKQTESILLDPPIKKVARPQPNTKQKSTDKSLPERLQDLKDALDLGLIAEEEYQTKRQKILEDF
jgi:Zn-dependent protease with chaperone function